MRVSLKESRIKSLNATNLDRKSGIRGPKTMGEAHHSLSFQTLPMSSRGELAIRSAQLILCIVELNEKRM
jgi:hypothetical protein